MYQVLPSSEFYKQIERNLANSGKPTSLSFEQLKESFDPYLYIAGYKTYTGYVLSQADADCLNNYTWELNRTRCISTRQLLLDKRHQMFCIIAEEKTPSELRLKS